MENLKLSLDAFKAKSETLDQTELLESVQGGGLMDCHGLSGAAGKYFDWLYHQ